MKRTFLLALCLTAGVCSSRIRAESIFDHRDRRAAYLFVDNRGRQVGDLVTLLINENTDIDQKENRSLDKKSKAGGKFSFLTAWKDGANSQAASGSIEADGSSNRSFNGVANFNSQRDVTDRMTVTIIDVMPNGNLLIEGSRRRPISGEERTQRVRGMIRPADISVVNTIESQFVADLNYDYDGKGVDTSFTSQGWLSRAVNKIWPF